MKNFEMRMYQVSLRKNYYRVCTSSEYLNDPICPNWIYFDAYSDEEACATAMRLTDQDLDAVVLQMYDEDFGFWDNALTP